MKKRIAALVCVAALMACCAIAFSACSGKQVAATVNGTEIYEETITSDVEAFRKSYSLEDEDSWGEWMANYGYTPSTVREAMIDSYVETELIKQAAKENDVSADSSEVDSYLQQMKANYSSDEAWNNALTSAGFTEETYKERIEESLLEQALMDKVTPLTDPDESTMLTYAQMYNSYYDGAKRSSHILFNAGDEATAQSVLDQINAGTLSFEDAAKQYSQDTGSASNGGDVGWDMLNSFVSEYTDALDGLSEGQVSGLVTSDYGIHIIKCTEVYTAPETLESVDQMPEAFRESIKETVQSYTQQNDFSTWLSDYEEQQNIVINDMPSGLSYDVDMSKYENTNDNSNSNSTNTNTSTNTNNEATNENSNTNNTNSNS